MSIFYLPAAFVAGLYELGVVLAITAALTDLEGYLARFLKCESEYGRHLDVKADKMYGWTMAGIGWALTGLNLAYVPHLSVLMSYDLGMWRLRRAGKVDAPCFAGKVKTFLLFPALIALSWQSTQWLPDLPAERIGFWLLTASCGFAIWSFLHHGKMVKDVPDPRPYLRRFIST
ncbi:hypothetical protein HY414_02265 [Candidatus Kaiserbacteria bacterium]|nr:hypothetical protein [Candidatus Kaiserbacteria bacterium]